MRHTICYELTNTFENVQSHYGRKVQRKTLINLIDIGLLISSLISIQHGNVILFEYFYLSFVYIRFSLIDPHSIECIKATKVEIRSFLDGWIRSSENKSALPLTLWTELGRRRSILIKNNSILPINFIEINFEFACECCYCMYLYTSKPISVQIEMNSSVENHCALY